MQKGGGILVAFGLIGGAVVGQLLGESSIGIVAGLLLGLLGAIIVGIVNDRRRR